MHRAAPWRSPTDSRHEDDPAHGAVGADQAHGAVGADQAHGADGTMTAVLGAPAGLARPGTRLPPGAFRRRARTVASLVLLGAAAVLGVVEYGTIEHTAGRLAQVDGGWLAVAVAAEAGSMVTFGRLQQRLLEAGGVRVGLGTMAAITTAADAMNGTLPGGVAWAAAWLYDQLGSRGVPRSLRVRTFLVAGGVSSFALFVVVAAGVEVAGASGPLASLRWLAAVLALLPAGAVAGAALARRSDCRLPVARAEALVRHRLPGGRRAVAATRVLVDQLAAVGLDTRRWLAVLGLAAANWLLDAAVLVATMQALGVPVPWRAILVVYGLTQISAALPLTPGGIGVVAGSLATLLRAYGMPLDDGLAVVLLYRIVSFWAVLPVGWGLWAALDFGGRRAGGRTSPGALVQRSAAARTSAPGGGGADGA